jgi:hypothetical protein
MEEQIGSEGEPKTAIRSQRVLSRGKDESVVLGTEAMTAFERMWGGIRHLSLDHPNRESFITFFLATLQPALNHACTLRLDLDPYSMKIKGQVVLELERPNENYIYRLYQDGIRQLVFHDGITIDEISRFLGILQGMFSDKRQNEDDIVTLLWDADLAHISYHAIEFFSEGSDNEGVDQLGESQASAEIGTNDIVNWATADVPITDTKIDMNRLVSARKSFHASDRSLRSRSKDLLDGVEEDTQQLAEHVFEFSEQERNALSQQMKNARQVNAGKFGEILFVSCWKLPEEQKQRLVDTFETYTHWCLDTNNIASLTQAVQILEKMGAVPQGMPVLDRFRACLLKDFFIDYILKNTAAGKLDANIQILLNFIAKEGFSLLWERLVVTQDSGTRNVLKDILSKMAPANIDFLSEQATSSHLNTVKMALSFLRSTDYDQVLPKLHNVFKHPDPEIRAEMLNLARKSQNSTVVHMVAMMMKDEDVRIRKRAIDVIGKKPGPVAEKWLLSSVEHVDFVKNPEDEQKRIIALLGKVARQKGLKAIRSVASGSGRTKHERSVRIAAINVLAERGDNTDIALLEKTAKGIMTNKDLKNAALAAVECIRRKEAKTPGKRSA